MNIKCMAAILSAGLVGASARAETNESFKVTGFASLDVASGYVLYGARSNDEPCLQTYGEFSVEGEPWGSIVASIWQNTDLTSARKNSFGRMNEWDYYLSYRNKFEFVEDLKLKLEFGHIWYKYHNLRSVAKPYYATMEEWMTKIAFENPYLTPHFMFSYDHRITHGKFMQGGVSHTFPLTDEFSFTPDLIIGGGDQNYCECLYPPFDGSISGGIDYVELSGSFAYWFNAHFGIHAKIAYVTIVDPDIRSEIKSTNESSYANDFFWGTIGVDIAF